MFLFLLDHCCSGPNLGVKIMRFGIRSINKNTPELMPMSGQFHSFGKRKPPPKPMETKMSPLNEGYPLLHCFHFGIAKPDHDVCESEAEG